MTTKVSLKKSPKEAFSVCVFLKEGLIITLYKKSLPASLPPSPPEVLNVKMAPTLLSSFQVFTPLSTSDLMPIVKK